MKTFKLPEVLAFIDVLLANKKKLEPRDKLQMGFKSIIPSFYFIKKEKKCNTYLCHQYIICLIAGVKLLENHRPTIDFWVGPILRAGSNNIHVKKPEKKSFLFLFPKRAMGGPELRGHVS